MLHTFSGEADGGIPGGVILDSIGNLYGVTSVAGSSSCGTVYKLDPAGNMTILYEFLGHNDGCNPVGSLVLDAAGHIFGATNNGGVSNGGTVYELQ